MKKILATTFGALAMLALSAGTSFAWHVSGTVTCAATGAPVPNVTIEINGTACGEVWVLSATTDSTGTYNSDLPDCDGNYTACVDTTTLPLGDTLIGNTCTSFSVVDSNQAATVNFSVNCGGPPCTSVPNCIQSNFNGTGVPQNNFIWFNSIIKVSGRNGGPATILFDGSTVNFTVNGNPVTINMPPAIIHFDASATTATTTYDNGSGTWMTDVPANFSGNVFLSGTMYQLPFNLPGGVNPVTWCGNFSADTTGLSFQWQWAAAAYEYPCALTSAGLNGLMVKPIDGTSMSAYPNGDHAGTPEYSGKSCVTGGTRGGGGSNWTGSYSPTKGAALCPGGAGQD